MLSTAEITAYRQRLLELMQRHQGDLSEMQAEALHGLGGEAGGGISNIPTHPADLGNATYEGEIGLGLMENEEQLLADSNAALARIDAGTYGLCEKCFQEIPKSRLQAVPYARYCVACARQLEERSSG